MEETIGSRIRRARLQAGITQAELGRRIGVTTQRINELEKREPQHARRDTLQRIATALSVDVDQLEHGRQDRLPELEEYLQLTQGMDLTTAQTVATMVRALAR